MSTSPETNEPERLPLKEWCEAFCPALPDRFDGVIAEWGIGVKDAERARNLLLSHVRQSVDT